MVPSGPCDTRWNGPGLGGGIGDMGGSGGLGWMARGSGASGAASALGASRGPRTLQLTALMEPGGQESKRKLAVFDRRLQVAAMNAHGPSTGR